MNEQWAGCCRGDVLSNKAAAVQVWVWRLPSLSDALAASLLPTLIAAEQDVYRTIRSPRRQREYLAGHALLRVALSGLFPQWQAQHRLVMDDGHHLHLAGPFSERIDFNLSHSGDWVACVVARDCRVGIDIEVPGRPRAYRALAQEYFASEESQRLADLSEDACRDAFYELWTLKESFLKARKEGISAAGLATRFIPSGQSAAPWYSYAFRLPCATQVFAALTVSAPLAMSLAIREYCPEDSAGGIRQWAVEAPRTLTPRGCEPKS